METCFIIKCKKEFYTDADEYRICLFNQFSSAISRYTVLHISGDRLTGISEETDPILKFGAPTTTNLSRQAALDTFNTIVANHQLID